MYHGWLLQSHMKSVDLLSVVMCIHTGFFVFSSTLVNVQKFIALTHKIFLYMITNGLQTVIKQQSVVVWLVLICLQPAVSSESFSYLFKRKSEWIISCMDEMNWSTIQTCLYFGPVGLSARFSSGIISASLNTYIHIKTLLDSDNVIVQKKEK